jgi:hypothetical protein
MKRFRIYIALFVFLAAMISCKKSGVPTLQSPVAQPHIYHIRFYDHKTGENITGLEAELLYIRNDLWGEYFESLENIRSDAEGAFSFDYGKSPANYLKISTQSYVDVLYNISESNDPNAQSVHSKEGSAGPNVVKAKLTGRSGNDFYFRADLYRKATLEIHFRQVNDYSNSNALVFNATINGKDPSNFANTFGTNDLVENGLSIIPFKKIDTIISVNGFGDYLNNINWNVYAIDNNQLKIIATGDSGEKIFPSDSPSKITITF